MLTECVEAKEEFKMDQINERWFPAEGPRGGHPYLPEVAYAVLGPHFSVEIAQALQKGAAPDSEVAEFARRLSDLAGTKPAMLYMMTACLGLAWDHSECKLSENASPVQRDFQNCKWEVYKTWGTMVELLLERFGFDRSTFAVAMRNYGPIFDDGNWPPRGVAYYREGEGWP